MIKKYHKYLAVVLLLLAIAGVFLIVYYFHSKAEKGAIVDIEPTTAEQIEEVQKLDDAEEEIEAENPKVSLPEKFLLDVPFQSQAPYGGWSQPYQDGCEEASIIMVKHFMKSSSLSKAEMKDEIDASVSWQEINWGGHFDLGAEKTLDLAQKYFGVTGQVVQSYSLEDFKKYISNGIPIIAPTAGRELGNPNFTGAGPEYHMLVIVGYNDSQGVFITNDPGTRKGESYIYKYQTLLDAISGPHVNRDKTIILLSRS